MFKKLASFLFEEEEIIVEEEELHTHKEPNYEIPKLDGIKAKSEKVQKVQEKEVLKQVEVEPTVLNKEENKEAVVKTTNKIQRIDVDGIEKKVAKEKPVTPTEKPQQESVYQPQEIISPIFGGSEKKAEPIRLNKPKKPSKQSDNAIISPMYGIVNEEKEMNIDQEILEYDLEDMLSPQKGPAEVQVSLYDYLEELSDDK